MSRIAPSSNYVDTFKLNRIANHHLCHARINQPKLNLVKFSTLFVNCINLSHPGYLKTSTYSPIQDISKLLHTLPSRISQNFYILSHPGYLKTSTYSPIQDISKLLHTLPSRISQNFYILSHPGYLKISTYSPIQDISKLLHTLPSRISQNFYIFSNRV
jgi:hypothetical protein